MPIPSDNSPSRRDASSEAPRGDGAMPDEQRQLVLVKHGQRYIFRYAPGDEVGMLENLIELARDPRSDLTWFDAALLSHQMGRRMRSKLESVGATTVLH